ncbi:MAG: hypothetical protein A2X82_15445 [Geobacteraceae bacterium GWC2_55_20]|nr:MAG: hypothetical protein A2X82_15445 [Geobacteraceae bacterium GWC2_55_20]OGU22332.1 MAG: hypothetical protein A2X85_13505 [Geobacteraceae bacterium GWF2_54_21]HCE68173.1 hypothetical protein [Geobacter sp.]
MKKIIITIAILITSLFASSPATAAPAQCVTDWRVDSWSECGWGATPILIGIVYESPAGACSLDHTGWNETTAFLGWINCSGVPQPDDGNFTNPETWRSTLIEPGFCNSPRYPAGYFTAYTDATITAGSSKFRAAHITELRINIDLMRADAGLANFSWTDPILKIGITRVKKVHIDELRTAIAEVYTTCGTAAPVFSDASITTGITKIKAAHINELRAAVDNAP